MQRECHGTNEPVKIYYTKDMFDNAVKHSKQINGDSHLRNSFTKGKSTVWGCLGEEIVSVWTAGQIMDDFEYDVLTPLQKKLEVKTKKTTSSVCEANYEASVCDFNSSQDCDYYVFVRVKVQETNDPSDMIAWICGYISKEEFKKKSVQFKKGDIDERNGYKVHADCHNIFYGDLSPLPACDEELI